MCRACVCAEANYAYHQGRSSWHTLNLLLDKILGAFGVQYGFIGRKLVKPSGVVHLQLVGKTPVAPQGCRFKSFVRIVLAALSNVAWSKDIEKLVVPHSLSFACDHGGECDAFGRVSR